MAQAEFGQERDIVLQGKATVVSTLEGLDARLFAANERGIWYSVCLPAIIVSYHLGTNAGVLITSYYLPSNFLAAGTSKSLSLLASGLDGTVQVGCTIVGLFLIDRVGRRHALGVGAAIMAFSLMVCWYIRKGWFDH